MFYDRFIQICKEKGVSPSKAAVEAGLSKSTVTRWKQNPEVMPSGTVLEQLGRYFNVPVSELLDEKEKPLDKDQELTELLERLSTRKEMRMLFQLADDATADEVRQAVRIIEAIRGK